jgi:hypothetical protein
MRCAAGGHGCDDLLADCADAIAELRKLLDRHLRSRPADYLATFLDWLAVEEQDHWSAVVGDFSDDFYQVACPHRAAEVTIAIGDYGHYSVIRDWHLGDVDRRNLRPASPDDLSAIVLEPVWRRIRRDEYSLSPLRWLGRVRGRPPPDGSPAAGDRSGAGTEFRRSSCGDTVAVRLAPRFSADAVQAESIPHQNDLPVPRRA